MKTQKAIDTQNRIVAAASQLFKEKHIAQTSISEITTKAGVAKGTFYIHFASKDDLIWHIIVDKLRTLFALFEGFASSGYAARDIDGMVDSVLAYVIENKDDLKMVHDARFFGFLGEENIAQRYYTEFDISEPLYLWLEKGLALGCIDVMDAKFTAFFMTNVIHEMIDKLVLDELPKSFDNVGDNLKYLIKKILEVKDDSSNDNV